MNLNFDNIDSELKAYLIGLFYADAYLNKRYLELTLSIKDKDYVEKLANIIGVNTHIRNIKNTEYKSIGFNIYGKEIVNSLRKIGFIEKKSYQRDDIVFKNIPDNLKRHFIRGYMDGDGTIFKSNYKKKNVDWKESIKYNVGFISINKELLESKTLKVDNKIINWYYIFQNISGYLPKLEIIYKKKNIP